MKLSKYLGLGLMGIACIIFYFCFFVIAPYVASTIPQGEWHNFLGVLVYVGIAYLGGIGLPIGLFIFGIVIMVIED